MSNHEPPCASCAHSVYRQCTKAWPDRSYSDTVVKRVIRIKDEKHPFPAHHVHRFWCQGRGFVPNGYSTEASAGAGDDFYYYSGWGYPA